MTVKELKTILKKFPEDMEVMICTINVDLFTHHVIRDVEMESVSFREDPEGPALAKDDCVVIKLE